MPEGLPGWTDDGDEEAPRRTTRPWVLVLATVPWLIVLGLVLGGVVSGERAGPPPPEAPGEVAGATAGHAPSGAIPADDAPADDVAAGDATEHRPAPPAGPGEPEARSPADTEGDPVGAVALAVARAWLTDVGPHLALEGIAPREDLYLEHGVVETVERHGDHAVVGVLAVVLVRDDERYTRVAARRIAVPVALGPPVRPAGAPWWLGDVDLTTTPPDPLVEEDDPDVLLELGEALSTAGVLDGEVLGAARTDDGWWLVRVGDPDTPGDPIAAWLRPSPTGPVVAGLALQRGADEHVHEE